MPILCHLLFVKLSRPSLTDLRGKASGWVTSLVLVRKRDFQFRLSGDHCNTANAAPQKAVYLLLTPEKALSQLQGGKIFSILNLAKVYQQLPVTLQ